MADDTKVVMVKFMAETTALLKGIDKAVAGLHGMGNATDMAGQKTTSMWASVTKGMIVSQLYAAAMRAVTDAIKAGISTITAFDKELHKTASIMDGVSKDSISFMTEETVRMAQAFGQSFESLGKARYDIVSSGFTNITDAMKILEASNIAAVAGVTDVATAADLLTSTLNAYGLGVDQATHANDIWFQTVKLGKIEFAELAQGIGQVLPTAKAAGVSLEEIGVALSTMTIAGVKPDIAMTALKNVFTDLVAPTKASADAMAQYGIKTKDLHGEMLPLQDVIKQFVGMPIDVIAKIIPDERSRLAVLALANNFDTLTANVQAFNDVSNVTQKAYEEVSRSIQTQLDRIKMGLLSLFILPDPTGTFSPFVDMLGSIADWLADNRIAIQEWAIDWGERIATLADAFWTLLGPAIIAVADWIVNMTTLIGPLWDSLILIIETLGMTGDSLFSLADIVTLVGLMIYNAFGVAIFAINGFLELVNLGIWGYAKLTRNAELAARAEANIANAAATNTEVWKNMTGGLMSNTLEKEKNAIKTDELKTKTDELTSKMVTNIVAQQTATANTQADTVAKREHAAATQQETISNSDLSSALDVMIYLLEQIATVLTEDSAMMRQNTQTTYELNTAVDTLGGTYQGTASDIMSANQQMASSFVDLTGNVNDFQSALTTQTAPTGGAPSAPTGGETGSSTVQFNSPEEYQQALQDYAEWLSQNLTPWHSGGMIGGASSLNSTPKDVPIMAQSGEAVLSREMVKALFNGNSGGSASGSRSSGGGSEMIAVSLMLNERELGKAVGRLDRRLGKT